MQQSTQYFWCQLTSTSANHQTTSRDARVVFLKQCTNISRTSETQELFDSSKNSKFNRSLSVGPVNNSPSAVRSSSVNYSPSRRSEVTSTDVSRWRHHYSRVMCEELFPPGRCITLSTDRRRPGDLWSSPSRTSWLTAGGECFPHSAWPTFLTVEIVMNR